MWNPACESMPRAQLERLQLSRLATQIARAGTLPVYRRRLEAAGLTQPDIRDLSEVPGLPLLTKDDLREAYPYGFCAAPREDLVRVHATSGTTGKLTVSPYTRADMDTWAELMARSLTATGVTRDDVVHNAYGYGLFTGGLGFDLGGQRVGCATIPISGGLTARQLMLIEDLRATVLTCTPSYALTIADELTRQGAVANKTSLRIGVFGAEPWTNEMRREIEAKLGIDAVDIYGLSEVMGPGVAMECVETKDGPHIWEDHFYPEVIDPQTGAPLPDGEEGELVFTALTKEALPIIRYRTRDLTKLMPGTARSMRRMGKITGRSDDMLIIRGVNMFPTQIEEILLRNPHLCGHYQIVVSRDHNLDELDVFVELMPDDNDGAGSRDDIARDVSHQIKTFVGVSARIHVVDPDTIERVVVGKAKRVVDKRPK